MRLLPFGSFIFFSLCKKAVMESFPIKCRAHERKTQTEISIIISINYASNLSLSLSTCRDSSSQRVEMSNALCHRHTHWFLMCADRLSGCNYLFEVESTSFKQVCAKYIWPAIILTASNTKKMCENRRKLIKESGIIQLQNVTPDHCLSRFYVLFEVYCAQ